MKSLIIVAHPDDEVLWFSSVLFRDNPDVICITSGRNKDDESYRKKAFEKTMDILNIENYEMLDHPDTDGRLNLSQLEKDLSRFTSEKYDRIFTHGPFGDTHNHIHHQDVSYLVNILFDNVFSTAWNLYPDVVNHLSRPEFDLKKYLMGTVYSEEYHLLMDSYEISAVEKFIQLTLESAEIFYWGIANFGDNHDRLGRKYLDFWGFENSPYEIERHNAILALVRKANAKKIIEYGACEGILTEKLSKLATVECTETAPIYRKRLREKGLNLVDDPKSLDYDLSILAAFLEYLEHPEKFLERIDSKFIIIDVLLCSQLDKKLDDLLGDYKKVNEIIVRPRWERMYHAMVKEKMEIYRLGAHCQLYEKKV